MEKMRIIEAALFMNPKEISLEELSRLLGLGTPGIVKQMIEELRKEYDERRSALEIIEMDGKYTMRVREQYLDRVKQYAKESELSKGALRTLALIARHDGIEKSTLAKTVGSIAYQDVKELTENGFITQKKHSRTSKLFLTEKFRQYFSLKEEQK